MIYIIIFLFIALAIFFYVKEKKCYYNEEENIISNINQVEVKEDDLKKYASNISSFYLNKNCTNCRKKLIKNLDLSYKKILEGYDEINKDVKDKKKVSPASEWILDNIYLLEREYRYIKDNMPRTYYKGLPIINKGIMRGYPRIYNIAMELILYTKGRVKEDNLKKFIEGYQQNVILTSGELWAIPIMIKIGLIQNISKIIEELSFESKERRKAEYIFDKLIEGIKNKKIDRQIQIISKEKINFNYYFSSELLKLLKDNSVDSKEIYDWINNKIDSTEFNFKKNLTSNHHKEAILKCNIENNINSIREIESLNWRDIFEELSLVEKILKGDPLGVYEKMDFESRDYYRHKIERLSKKLKVSELFIAKKALECTKDIKEEIEYKKHIGYYLIDEGLEKLKFNLGIKDKGLSYIKKYRDKIYIGAILAFTAILVWLILRLNYINDNNVELFRYIIGGIFLIIPSSQIVISIINWSIIKLSNPGFIPKIDFKDGIGDKNKTIVVIPNIVSNEKKLKELILDLEVYYLSNKDKNIYFALLTDFKDSQIKEEKEDKVIVSTGLKYIKELNEKYSENGDAIFYFFSRYRKYNKKECKWIGWERKRGKLMEFNALIRGDKNTSYNVISGDISNLLKAKYIITLDADTKLPRDSAKKLIGAMSHILNKPYIDENKKRVIRGYGIMQPKISVSIVSSNKTLFSKIFSGDAGIDIYTTAVSDVYQDVFGEGIFTGKGIYDIDVFNYMLKGEIEENKVLSHDLLEGSYVRCGLVTDVEFIDDYPAYYNSSSRRLHRWVRGDWQLLSWIRRKTSINTLSKFKILDNLRRSLISPSIIILILLSFSVLPQYTERWIILSIVILICPLVFHVTEYISNPIRGTNSSVKLYSLKVIIEQVLLTFIFLPYSAYIMADAIIRTLYRLVISKRNFLEWQTAADVEKNSGKKFINYIKLMWPSSVISTIIFLCAFNRSTDIGICMVPSCILWFISPVIAYIISKDLDGYNFKLSKSQDCMLRKIARKTWAYFEDFVNEENNWLSPDNYQEKPKNGLASRTSPTNIGMGLTSNIVAYDLGYIDLIECVDRIYKNLKSMDELEMYKGHLYNWYNTITKEALYPKYVSTVDSGNLVGYLWLVEETVKEFLKSPFLNKNIINGLCDTLYLCNDEIYEILNIKDYYIKDIEYIENEKLDLIKFKNLIEELYEKTVDAQNIKKDKIFYWNDKLKRNLYNINNNIIEYFPNIQKITCEDKEYRKIEKLILNTPIDKINDIEININIKKLIDKINWIIKCCDEKVKNTDFKVLYNSKRGLFSIGYDVENNCIGNGYYDLLASEARVASFVSIAKGDVETKHWFNLGRAMTKVGENTALVSWSGTMFEYLMPLLIMKPYKRTLLSETYKAIVKSQIKYGKIKKVPWGISESGYMTFDVNLNYQYKAFGVPGIGLKRGLMDELVISPYSTIMALQVDTKKAIKNIKKLKEEGLCGRYGFYEAIDYTDYRDSKKQNKGIIKSFMVHHEGMSLMALDNVLKNNILRNRFHKNPNIKSVELLLQEKISNKIVHKREENLDLCTCDYKKEDMVYRKFDTWNTNIPETQLLSNGSYSLMITNRGTGYGKKEDMTVYRWKEDVTTDNSGMFFYIKNIKNNNYWSATYEPCKIDNDNYKVIFSENKATFKRKDENIITKTEVIVSFEEDSEIRKISLTNIGEEEEILEVTSYLEVTLAPFNSDLVHPAFSNLFIRTEYIKSPECIIANRRPRAKFQNKPYVMQCVVVDGKFIEDTQYETSRVNFIGRDRTLKNPIAITDNKNLTNSIGAVLDPIISIRKKIKLNKGETCSIFYITSVGNSREEVIKIAEKYKNIANIYRAFELSFNDSLIEMKYMNIKFLQANLYQSMASRILYLSDLYKKREKFIKNLTRGQMDLWKYGISGDLPIVLVIVKKDKEIHVVNQMIKAHEYWSKKGLKVDLVILNLQNVLYNQPLQDSIKKIISTSYIRDKENKPGGVFLYNKTTFDREDIDLLMAISKIVIYGDCGLLSKQIKDEVKKDIKIPTLKKLNKKYKFDSYDFNINNLEFFNGIGGFDLENENYTIILENYKVTPAPWINVISNENFGFMVSESGSPCTWCKNSRENKITTWSNDWVTDIPSESMYIKDEESGETWSITPKPIRDNGKYIIEHGFGYSTFKHYYSGIIGEVTMFVPRDENLKICKVTLKNNSCYNRKLSIFYYAQLVLGVVPQHTSIHISTYLNNDKKYIYGVNKYSANFKDLKAYLKIIGGVDDTFTGDRKEFIGSGKSVENPKALEKNKLSDTVGAGMDPCLCENTKVDLKPLDEKTILIVLGQEEDIDIINKKVDKYSDIKRADIELNNIKNYWRDINNTIKVKTPDKSMDIMLNGWLMYQTISCRIWARSAFYQSGGAFGFRDQLQDVMTAGYVNPKMMRDHIIYSASRQFTEGDVQHWWHPVVDSGIRTRFSDDLLWLPYVTIDYITRTDDYDILDEKALYLRDEPLKDGEDERYKISDKSNEVGSIYEHCIKAIDRSLKFGSHNIPLMGSGDWNDGMSEVGNGGKGESVWLGWFLYSILDGFKEIVKFKGDNDKYKEYDEYQKFIKENIEKNGWDGSWYRRAYFDDGTPLGSKENDECKIDSLAQSWSVISRGGDKKHVKIAMNSLEEYLIKEKDGMVLLLTPPFENSKLEPGYIKGYVPGVRENGGQYTHASTWVILALAMIGEGDKAWKVYNMLNPINHTKTYDKCEKYKVEPYVITADVYEREPYIGRGGWSWYTGAAGWMYRVAIEGILGLKFKGKEGFIIEPNIPKDWNGFSIEYNKDGTRYLIDVVRGDKNKLEIDGIESIKNIIPFMMGKEHKIKLFIKD